ncbi:MAG: CPBP family intramembrane glutamic endopeptidase [Acidobacteriota bacterium]|jgi:membrane protease YdiL (CAAX protease family)
MNDELRDPPPPLAPPKTWVLKAQALFEVILLAGVVSSLLAMLPFAFSASRREHLLENVGDTVAYLLLEAAITLLLMFLVMRAHGETLRWLGLSWARWGVNVLAGLAIVPLLFFLNLVVSLIFQTFFPKYFMESNPLTELVQSPRDLLLLTSAALIAGGFKEELQRAFILRRFQTYLGGAWLGLMLWSIVFGLGHYLQGAQGVVAATLFGLIFGAVYLIRRNLIIPMAAHGTYDTLALVGYWLLTHHK